MDDFEQDYDTPIYQEVTPEMYEEPTPRLFFIFMLLTFIASNSFYLLGRIAIYYETGRSIAPVLEVRPPTGTPITPIGYFVFIYHLVVCNLAKKELDDMTFNYKGTVVLIIFNLLFFFPLIILAVDMTPNELVTTEGKNFYLLLHRSFFIIYTLFCTVLSFSAIVFKKRLIISPISSYEKNWFYVLAFPLYSLVIYLILVVTILR